MRTSSFLLVLVAFACCAPGGGFAASSPDAVIAEFVSALQGKQFNAAAHAFRPELSTAAGEIADVERRLEILESEVGMLSALRSAPHIPVGITVAAQIAIPQALSDTRQVIATVQSVFSATARNGSSGVYYVVAVEQSHSGWRVRELVVHFPADYPNLRATLQRLEPSPTEAPRRT